MYMKGVQKLKVHVITPILYKSHNKIPHYISQSTLPLTTSLPTLKTTPIFVMMDKGGSLQGRHLVIRRSGRSFIIISTSRRGNQRDVL